MSYSTERDYLREVWANTFLISENDLPTIDIDIDINKHPLHPYFFEQLRTHTQWACSMVWIAGHMDKLLVDLLESRSSSAFDLSIRHRLSAAIHVLDHYCRATGNNDDTPKQAEDEDQNVIKDQWVPWSTSRAKLKLFASRWQEEFLNGNQILQACTGPIYLDVPLESLLELGIQIYLDCLPEEDAIGLNCMQAGLQAAFPSISPTERLPIELASAKKDQQANKPRPRQALIGIPRVLFISATARGLHVGGSGIRFDITGPGCKSFKNISATCKEARAKILSSLDEAHRTNLIRLQSSLLEQGAFTEVGNFPDQDMVGHCVVRLQPQVSHPNHPGQAFYLDGFDLADPCAKFSCIHQFGRIFCETLQISQLWQKFISDWIHDGH